MKIFLPPFPPPLSWIDHLRTGAKFSMFLLHIQSWLYPVIVFTKWEKALYIYKHFNLIGQIQNFKKIIQISFLKKYLKKKIKKIVLGLFEKFVRLFLSFC